MTEKKLAANRSNGRLSHGPATAAGRERIAAAHLRHGRYSESQDTAFRCWDEDPAEDEDLLEGLCEDEVQHLQPPEPSPPAPRTKAGEGGGKKKNLHTKPPSY
jgi:hypothetical protein